MRENRSSGLMRGGSLTVIGVRTSHPVRSRLLYIHLQSAIKELPRLTHQSHACSRNASRTRTRLKETGRPAPFLSIHISPFDRARYSNAFRLPAAHP